MKFSEKLQKMRKVNNLSQEQLADMLDVSRQSVSKWESGQTYPEMDKLISMCKIFKCSLDDLTNDGITEINITNKPKYNINNFIDEMFEVINKTYKMFTNMNFKSIIKLLLEMFLVIFIIALFRIPFDYILDLGSDIFENFGSKIGNILISVWSFIINIVYMIAAIIIFAYIFKIRYLDRYSINGDQNEIVDEEDKADAKKSPIVIKESSKHDFAIFNVLATICVYFVKFVVLGMLFIFALSLLFLFVCLVTSIILLFKGVVYIGILLGIIAFISLNVIVLEYGYNFLFNKSTNHKRIFITFLSSIGVLGLAISITIFDVANTTYIDTPPKELMNVVEKEVPFNENMVVSYYWIDGIFEYIEDEKMQDKILVKVSHYDDFSNIVIDVKNNNLTILKDYKDSFAYKKYIDSIIKDLSKREIRNYSQLYTYKVKLYTSKSNIERLSKNEAEYNKGILEDSNQQVMEEYQRQIDELYQRVVDLEETNSDLDNEISEYKYEIEKYENKIQEYKDKINSLLIE